MKKKDKTPLSPEQEKPKYRRKRKKKTYKLECRYVGKMDLTSCFWEKWREWHTYYTNYETKEDRDEALKNLNKKVKHSDIWGKYEYRILD